MKNPSYWLASVYLQMPAIMSLAVVRFERLLVAPTGWNAGQVRQVAQGYMDMWYTDREVSGIVEKVTPIERPHPGTIQALTLIDLERRTQRDAL